MTLRRVSLLFAFLVFPALVTADSILVAYPETRSFYRPFYNDILKGIQSALLLEGIKDVEFLVIDRDTDTQVFLTTIKKQHHTGIILLGAAGLRLTALLASKTKIPLITAANNVSHAAYPDISGVSILTDPSPLLDFVHRLLPSHKNIVMVANMEHGRDHLDVFYQDIHKINMTHSIKQTHSLTESSNLYKTLLPTLKQHADILWLSNDPVAMETGTLFPSLLMDAWTYKIPIVSNALSHRGVMVGAYPDPKKYGEQIVKLLFARINSGDLWVPHIELASHIKITFNRIFASHIGVNLPGYLRKDVAIIYE